MAAPAMMTSANPVPRRALTARMTQSSPDARRINEGSASSTMPMARVACIPNRRMAALVASSAPTVASMNTVVVMAALNVLEPCSIAYSGVMPSMR